MTHIQPGWQPWHQIIATAGLNLLPGDDVPCESDALGKKQKGQAFAWPIR
jgi:hypothetical protein